MTLRLLVFPLLALVFLVAACAPAPTQAVETEPPVAKIVPTQPLPTSTLTSTPSQTATPPLPTLIPTRTLAPTLTMLPGTANAIATQNALLNQLAKNHDVGFVCPMDVAVECRSAGFSPDRRWAYFRKVAKKNPVLLLSVDGARAWQLDYCNIVVCKPGMDAGWLNLEAWDRDGRHLYVSANSLPDDSFNYYLGDSHSLVRVDLATGRWLDLGFWGALQFSPNRRYLASTLQREIRIRDLQTGLEQAYTIRNQRYVHTGAIVWSPDSTKFIFLAAPKNWNTGLARFSLLEFDLVSQVLHQRWETDQLSFPYRWDDPGQVIVRIPDAQWDWSYQTLDLSTLPASPLRILPHSVFPTPTPTIQPASQTMKHRLLSFFTRFYHHPIRNSL